MTQLKVFPDFFHSEQMDLSAWRDYVSKDRTPPPEDSKNLESVREWLREQSKITAEKRESWARLNLPTEL